MLIAIDAGHGGSDPGAVYNGRQEKDDTLALALAVGKILQACGVDVVYTRTEDIYETPYQKAVDGNTAGADYFVSIHRNSSEVNGIYSGVQTLIYSEGGAKETLARNIQNELVGLGFKDLGLDIRPNLVVLRRTQMPAVLVEVGFINNDADNQKFDSMFQEIAQAIANGIFETIGYDTCIRTVGKDLAPDSVTETAADPMTAEPEETTPECQCEKLYRVQVGAYTERENADRMLNSLLELDFPAFIVYQDGYYKVQVGAFRNIDNAVSLERRLRLYRYRTFITV